MASSAFSLQSCTLHLATCQVTRCAQSAAPAAPQPACTLLAALHTCLARTEHGSLAILTNAKNKDSEPDYRVVSRKNGFELGAGWKRVSQSSGSEYVSVSLSAPEFGTIYGNIANSPGNDPEKKVIIWNPPA